jgi:heterodisulfide reductase subunit D
MDKLSFPEPMERAVAFHEPCKTAYMVIHTDATAEILKRIPGTKYIEMVHHGKDTLCCACRAAEMLPEAGDQITCLRLKEAIDAGADTIIDVCHNCHLIFLNYQEKNKASRKVDVVNYSTYITNAMGIHRRDVYKEQKCLDE